MTRIPEDPLVQSLSDAVERSPDAIELRLHLAELLFERARYTEALAHCSTALSQHPANRSAVELLQRCTAALASPAAASAGTAEQTSEPSAAAEQTSEPEQTPAPKGAAEQTSEPEQTPAPKGAAEQTSEPEQTPAPSGGFDWSEAERQVADIVEPAFVESPEIIGDADYDVVQPARVRLTDVAGMADVKRQLELSLLGPIRQPELMKAFKISARGGLLLYGPPGCGKTFIAKAVAGELGASFYPIGISDVMQYRFGESEQRIRTIFETARRNAPCVLFFDELDALGHKRSALSGWSGLRTVVNTMLEQFDSAATPNDGVYVLGATNHPWDVDSALRRPGRFDRMIFVGLPDAEARAAIVRLNLHDRPVAGIDAKSVAARTDGFSGADLAHVCDSATQLALADSIQTGQARPVTMADINTALAQIKPSTGPWFETARNVVEFGNQDGAYDDLAKYMRRKRFR